jgi:hypothetical protein
MCIGHGAWGKAQNVPYKLGASVLPCRRLNKNGILIGISNQ